MASKDIVFERKRNWLAEAKLLDPAVGQRCQPFVEAPPQFLHQGWQRIGKVAIFACPEPVPCHGDLASEHPVVVIAAYELGKLFPVQKLAGPGEALAVDLGEQPLPVDCLDAFLQGHGEASGR